MASYSSILAWGIPGTQEPVSVITVQGVTKSETQLKGLGTHARS